MERMLIQKFGGLKELDIKLNKINVFIGKQASGKSITAKLLYLFKGIYRDIYKGTTESKSKTEIDKEIITKFQDYFPSNTWSTQKFNIQYFLDEHFIKIYRVDANNLKIEYSDSVKKLFSVSRRIVKRDKNRFSPKDEFDVYRPSYELSELYYSTLSSKIGDRSGFSQLYIPAGRSFFANLQNNIFSFLSNNKSIDPFLIEFGSFYESIKPIASRDGIFSRNEKGKILSLFKQISQEIINSEYLREKNQDFLIHKDKRKINVSFASSGQQETLPLLLILKALLRISFTGNGATLYIEEPEAHLFPTAQKKIVELLSLVANHAQSKVQLIITTHSPYILTSFNNLAQAGIIKQSLDTNKEKLAILNTIVDPHLILEPNLLEAFTLKGKTGNSIIDKETMLIHSEYLDSVSEDIAEQFDEFLNLI